MLGGVYLNTGTIPSKSMREGRYSIKYKIKKKKKKQKKHFSNFEYFWIQTKTVPRKIAHGQRKPTIPRLDAKSEQSDQNTKANNARVLRQKRYRRDLWSRLIY